MSRVQRVAEQDDVFVVPATVLHERKVQPAHEVVRHQRMAAEIVCEEPLEIRAGLLLGHRREPRPRPRRRRTLDDERACRLVELVGVRGEHAVGALAEREREAVKELVRAEPDVFVAANVDGWLESVGKPLADEAVRAVRADEQIVIAERCDVGHVRMKTLLDAERLAAVSQNLEKRQPADPGEPVASNADPLATMDDVDVVPGLPFIGEGLRRRRVVIVQVPEGLIREDDAPSERVVAAVALENHAPRDPDRAASSAAKSRGLRVRRRRRRYASICTRPINLPPHARGRRHTRGPRAGVFRRRLASRQGRPGPGDPITCTSPACASGRAPRSSS